MPSWTWASTSASATPAFVTGLTTVPSTVCAAKTAAHASITPTNRIRFSRPPFYRAPKEPPEGGCGQKWPPHFAIQWFSETQTHVGFDWFTIREHRHSAGATRRPRPLGYNLVHFAAPRARAAAAGRARQSQFAAVHQRERLHRSDRAHDRPHQHRRPPPARQIRQRVRRSAGPNRRRAYRAS